MKERRLGMGLDALLGGQGGPALISVPEPKPEELIHELPLAELRANRYQPRLEFDTQELQSLAESIKTSGLLQPIIVRQSNGYYEIVSGERRFRASQLAGLQSVPSIIRKVTDEEMLTLALVENVQRKDLNAIEKARAFQQLLQIRHWTQEQLADSLSIARSTVANFIRLLELPQEIQEAVSRGTISMGHARALAGLTNRAQTARLLRRLIQEDLSVRALERTIANETRPARKATRPGSTDPLIEDLQHKLTEFFGTKTEIQTQGKGGRILLTYYSTEQLSGILQRLGVSA